MLFLRLFIKMTYLLRTSLLFLLFILFNSSLKMNSNEGMLISDNEYLLYDSINKYRKSKGLDSIPLSIKLSKVAQLHCEDLEKNYTRSKVCNLHSWSATSDKWSSCCYTSDHKKAKCMWEKPREIANYNSEGYEIAYYNSNKFGPYIPLEKWKSSVKGHNKVIVNLGLWKKAKWKAIGVGLTDHYACVWFGMITDTTNSAPYLKKPK